MKRSAALAFLVPQLVAAGLALATGTPGVCAQNVAPYTLHVYTNLVQVPTLVLGEDLRPVPLIKREQFTISLDQGPAFHPTQMRIEGDDPISLAVLLDARGDQDDILRAIRDALPRLVPRYLHPTDQFSIYAIDCTLVGTGDQIPADAAALMAGVASVLASPTLHGTQQRGACGSSIHLWDAIVSVTGILGNRPGRRVLLVVSRGMDGKSTGGLAEVTKLAGSRSVAIFGLRYLEGHIHATYKYPFMFNPNVRVGTPTDSSSRAPDLFDQICESSGGLAFNLWNPDLTNRWTRDVTTPLQDLLTMLRGRYILEFPRPDDYNPGLHRLDISVPRTHDLVLTTGVAYPSPDPTLLLDPTTVPSSPSPAVFGTRRPPEPKQ